MLKKLNFFMKKLIFLCLVLISNTCLSQELLWEINNTGSNHTLLLPLEENVTLDGVEIDESALVGVFTKLKVVDYSVADLPLILQISFRLPLMEMMRLQKKKMGLTVKKIFNGILILTGLITQQKLFTL